MRWPAALELDILPARRPVCLASRSTLPVLEMDHQVECLSIAWILKDVHVPVLHVDLQYVHVMAKSRSIQI